MKIRIAFGNMWGGFDTLDNVITNSLKLKYDVEVTAHNPDIVFVQNTEGVKAQTLTDPFRGKAKRVHWHVESGSRVGDPDYNVCDYSITTCTFDHERNFRLPHWSLYIDWFNNAYVEGRNQAFLVSPEVLTAKRTKRHKTKFCCVLSNNPMGYRGQVYPKFISMSIDKGLFMESRGLWSATSPRLHGDELDKMNFIDSFKFHLCFENDDFPGYITEKIIHPLACGVIPIYWGTDDILNEFNPECFINAKNFVSPEELFNHVYDFLEDKESFAAKQEQPIFPNNEIPYYAKPEYFAEKLSKIVEA